MKDAARKLYNSIVNSLEELGKNQKYFAGGEEKNWKIICSNVDKFCYGSNKEFEKKITGDLRERIMIGKEEGGFRFNQKKGRW